MTPLTDEQVDAIAVHALAGGSCDVDPRFVRLFIRAGLREAAWIAEAAKPVIDGHTYSSPDHRNAIAAIKLAAGAEDTKFDSFGEHKTPWDK